MTTALSAEPRSGFHSLSLRPELLASLDRAGYLEPTPIQAAFIPEALAGRDVIGQAQTGTGKTAAFLLPFLNQLARGRRRRARRPSSWPRRASWSCRSPRRPPSCPPARTAAPWPIYGGQRFRTQLTQLQPRCGHRRRHAGPRARPPVARHPVAGPRPLRRPRRGRPDARHRLPPRHRAHPAPLPARSGRRCCCRPRCRRRCCGWPSATWSIRSNINLSPEKVTVENIRQSYITVDEDRKFDLLLRVLEREEPRQCIIFCERKRWAERPVPPAAPRTASAWR